MALLQLCLFTLIPSSSSSSISSTKNTFFFNSNSNIHHRYPPIGNRRVLVGCVGKEDTTAQLHQSFSSDSDSDSDSDSNSDSHSQDLEYIRQIKRVLELLKKNRDMLFNEIKLTIMIEDPREVERRRLLGMDDSDTPSRDDLADVLQQVNDGKLPHNRAALRMLADEMINWPNLEVEPPKQKRGKSLYAKATDTGVDPQEAAKRLNIDWDSAAEIQDADMSDDPEVPAAVGYGALYIVTAFPVIIGISVVLILFYNSLR